MGNGAIRDAFSESGGQVPVLPPPGQAQQTLHQKFKETEMQARPAVYKLTSQNTRGSWRWIREQRGGGGGKGREKG